MPRVSDAVRLSAFLRFMLVMLNATGFAFAIEKEINAKDAKDAKDAKRNLFVSCVSCLLSATFLMA